jgi:hypothetical protein
MFSQFLLAAAVAISLIQLGALYVWVAPKQFGKLPIAPDALDASTPAMRCKDFRTAPWRWVVGCVGCFRNSAARVWGTGKLET